MTKINTTSETLKAYDPRFVGLDEAQEQFSKLEKVWIICAEAETNDFVHYARKDTRPLLDAYAQALVKLARARNCLSGFLELAKKSPEVANDPEWPEVEKGFQALLKELGEG